MFPFNKMGTNFVAPNRSIGIDGAPAWFLGIRPKDGIRIIINTPEICYHEQQDVNFQWKGYKDSWDFSLLIDRWVRQISVNFEKESHVWMASFMTLWTKGLKRKWTIFLIKVRFFLGECAQLSSDIPKASFVTPPMVVESGKSYKNELSAIWKGDETCSTSSTYLGIYVYIYIYGYDIPVHTHIYIYLY